MNKKLGLTDYMLMLLILAILVGALGAFFYGVKIGKDKTAAKYERILAAKQEESSAPGAYHQQYLVSFYHTIYLPYRDFQKKWFERIEALELGDGSVDARDVFKELAKLAEQKVAEIEPLVMPDSSPLLQEAQDNYLKSLKLFAEASERFRSRVGAQQGAVLMAALKSDAYFQEAGNFGLAAQTAYYASIVRWNASIQPDLAGTDLPAKSDLTLVEWASLNLNLKNEMIARTLESLQRFELYVPQDVTLRVDEMIADGQADRLNLTSIRAIVEMLAETDAVRSGDYLKRKTKFYQNETLPQLPFFHE